MLLGLAPREVIPAEGVGAKFSLFFQFSPRSSETQRPLSFRGLQDRTIRYSRSDAPLQLHSCGAKKKVGEQVVFMGAHTSRVRGRDGSTASPGKWCSP